MHKEHQSLEHLWITRGFQQQLQRHNLQILFFTWEVLTQQWKQKGGAGAPYYSPETSLT